MNLSEYDAIMRSLVGIAVHQDTINERVASAIERIETTLARVELTLQAIKDLFGRGNGH